MNSERLNLLVTIGLALLVVCITAIGGTLLLAQYYSPIIPYLKGILIGLGLIMAVDLFFVTDLTTGNEEKLVPSLRFVMNSLFKMIFWPGMLLMGLILILFVLFFVIVVMQNI